jgi:predicted nucleic acid-binding protein
MKILFDTSVLVAAMVEAHPRHADAFPWLQKARAGRIGYFVCAHTLAELFSVLSTLPTSPRPSPALARRLIHENVEAAARIVALSRGDYSAVVREVAALGLSGGVVYDALIARAARKGNVDRLLTLNAGDFLRVWPGGEKVIASP